MRALTWQGNEDVRVEEVDDPRIEQPTDAIVRVTSTAIDTVAAPALVLREIRRVLSHDGRSGILAYAATEPFDRASAPSGNHLQTTEELLTDIAEADLVVFDQTEGSTLPTPPLDWTLRQDRLEHELGELHRRDPRWIDSVEKEQAFGQLLSDGLVAPLLIHAMPV